jgi:hypothetical protein
MKKTVKSQKRRGPAPTGKGMPVLVRLQPPALVKLDRWIKEQNDKQSRPEAIRRLVEQALDAASPPKHIARMAPLKGEPPGMERDGRGHAIPMKKRLPEDRAKAKRARMKKR